ncbi:ArsC/Spx/MgsR family protein [Pelagicoccus albus]|uniref:Arsenate reductase family protein n=1 Tax=Pelagicoccus albus TaxID=415222 RepID=A0A7X1B6I7_9BACT|nr:ArsC/Spx/MgsR family protein [Pelagicoccus albus]MBC2606584.1 arsenate reductase family protein [Pelagicoccus albus]
MKQEGNYSGETKGIVSLYGKAGCQGNARQVKQLKSAGYVVQFIDLLSRKLEASELTKFTSDRPLHDCVNQRAPLITSGEFDPSTLDEDDLLQAMVENPILIKRPLLFYRGHFACGFDHPLVEQLLGETPPELGCQKHDACNHN